MRPVALLFAMLMLMTQPTACSATHSESGLPVIPLTIDGHKLKVELARAADEQSRGLMYRRKMSDKAGMLFIYEDKANLSFWMKNTFIPLTIAFIDDDGVIVHLEDMAPQTRTSHRSPEKVRYALEVNRGWFKERGIEVGAKAEFELPDDPRKTP